MTLLVATNAGVRVVTDVVVDSPCDRLVSLSRHLGDLASWTSSAGTIAAIRDGAEAFEVDVDVTGPFSGAVQLLAPGSRVAAATPVVDVASGAALRVKFRVSRAHDRDAVLAAPVP